MKNLRPRGGALSICLRASIKWIGRICRASLAAAPTPATTLALILPTEAVASIKRMCEPKVVYEREPIYRRNSISSLLHSPRTPTRIKAIQVLPSAHSSCPSGLNRLAQSTVSAHRTGSLASRRGRRSPAQMVVPPVIVDDGCFYSSSSSLSSPATPTMPQWSPLFGSGPFVCLDAPSAAPLSARLSPRKSTLRASLTAPLGG